MDTFLRNLSCTDFKGPIALVYGNSKIRPRKFSIGVLSSTEIRLRKFVYGNSRTEIRLQKLSSTEIGVLSWVSSTEIPFSDTYCESSNSCWSSNVWTSCCISVMFAHSSIFGGIGISLPRVSFHDMYIPCSRRGCHSFSFIGISETCRILIRMCIVHNSSPMTLILEIEGIFLETHTSVMKTMSKIHRSLNSWIKLRFY